MQAGDEHSRELQSLRAQSQRSIEEVQAANKTAFADLRASLESEHESLLRDEEKRRAAITLELKATQDDLSKAKAALAALTPEIETLKVELDRVNLQANSR